MAPGGYDPPAVPSWLLKAAAQGTISLLPGRHRLNSLLQRHLTGTLALGEALFETKVGQCRHHLQRFRQLSGLQRPPDAALELGTGWYPVVPIGLALAGTGAVTTIDVSSLLERERVRRTVALYASALESGRLRDALPRIDSGRAAQVLAASRAPKALCPTELLAVVGVRAVVGDVRAARLPADSTELLVSNNTLEHIPPCTLVEILAELRRLAAAGAVMDHFVDISDHYAHFDRSISEFNYLRFPPAVWRLFNNPLQYQNRLRASDYRNLIEGAGFRVVDEETERGEAAHLERLKVVAAFRRYSRDDLLVLRAWFTAVADRPAA